MKDVSGIPQTLVRPRWPDRQFAFVHPSWMLSDFTERLRGLLPRLQELFEIFLAGIAEPLPRSFGEKDRMTGMSAPDRLTDLLWMCCAEFDQSA